MPQRQDVSTACGRLGAVAGRCERWAIHIDSLLPAYARASELWRTAGAHEGLQSIDAIRCLVPPGAESDEDWWDRIAELGVTYRDTYRAMAHGTANLESGDLRFGLDESTRDWDAAAMRLVDALEQVDPRWFKSWGGPEPRPRRQWAITRWLGSGESLPGPGCPRCPRRNS